MFTLSSIVSPKPHHNWNDICCHHELCSDFTMTYTYVACIFCVCCFCWLKREHLRLNSAKRPCRSPVEQLHFVHAAVDQWLTTVDQSKQNCTDPDDSGWRLRQSASPRHSWRDVPLCELTEACAGKLVDEQLHQLAVEQNTKVTDNVNGANNNSVNSEWSISWWMLKRSMRSEPH